MNVWDWRKFKEDGRHAIRAMLEPRLWLHDMGGRPSLRQPRVYGVTYPQLGDHWVALCHLVRFRRASQVRHLLGIQPSITMTVEQRVSLLRQIATILDVVPELEFTDKPPELELPIHPARNGTTLLAPGADEKERELIAYQFDGISHPHLNPTAAELDSFFGCFGKQALCRLGRPLTLGENIKILTKSKLFIGVSSGMSHLAASANTPAFIFLKGGARHPAGFATYQHLRRWNPYPNTQFFSTVDELKRKLKDRGFVLS